MLFHGIRGWWLVLGLIAGGAVSMGCVGESPCEYTATCPPPEGGLEDTTASENLDAASETDEIESTEPAVPETTDADPTETDDEPKPIPTITFPPVLPVSQDLPPDAGPEDDEADAGVEELDADAELSEPEATCCETSSVDSECDSGLVCDGPCERTSDCPPSVLVCSGEHINCDDGCIDPSSNNTYCGASATCTGQNRGEVCASNESCESGVCRMQCPGAQVPCNGRCIDPASDEAYCGASNNCEGNDAGVMCVSGQQCLSGSCRSPDGAACTVGIDCISGVCATFFLDIDGDGYGAQSSGMQRVCGLQPPTAGYVTNNLDCCDNASDLTLAAEANPDFSGLPSRALSIPECSKPFDWNCDGVETPSAPRGGCAQHTNQASCQGSFADNPACGTVAEFHYCYWNTDDNECVRGSIEGVMMLCY